MKSPKARAVETGTLIGVRLQADTLARVDEWRRDQSDLPTRPEAIRRMIDEYFDKGGEKQSFVAFIRAEIARIAREPLSDDERIEQISAMSDDDLISHFSMWFLNELIKADRRSSKKRRGLS